jgi:hypothetical protein
MANEGDFSMRLSSFTALVCLSLAGCEPAQAGDALEEAVQVPGPKVHNFAGGKTSGGASPLIDHGGAVLPASSVYAIYWGTASDFPSDLKQGMDSLLGGFAGSSYLGIAQQYMRGAAVSNVYQGSIDDPSAPPKNAPTTAALGLEVCKLFPNPDPNTLYVVFTSNAPKIRYCAWHDKTTCNGVTFQVAYVPNQALLSFCSPYVAANLHCNGYSGGTVTSADSVAHEFMEAISDAHIDAWYDKNGQEMADKCEYNYTACVGLKNGSSWQIQTEWSNALGACQQQ